MNYSAVQQREQPERKMKNLWHDGVSFKIFIPYMHALK